MYNLYHGEDLVKYNPIYTVKTNPNNKTPPPTEQKLIRWTWYFKNFEPRTR